MPQIYLAYDGGLAILRRQNDYWTPTLTMVGRTCQSLAVDRRRPELVYCGSFDAGLWRSDDAGATWQPTPGILPHVSVMAVTVDAAQEANGRGIVWAGTEPSALFRSQDGGESWHECAGLQDLPSKSTWRFPPRPWTHHVRWIEPDANVANRLFVGIELGGVMRSLDGGATWEDRKPGSQHDCHTLRTHPLAPGVVYEAAGGGFAESHDGGETWHSGDEGLRHHYLWGLAVDPAAPDVLVVSASPGARSAHNDEAAEAALYRRVGSGAWQPLEAGLPDPSGTRAYVLATHPAEAGVFYAATRQNVYRSSDAGLSWQPLAIAWPNDVRFSSVNAMAVTDSN